MPLGLTILINSELPEYDALHSGFGQIQISVRRWRCCSLLVRLINAVSQASQQNVARLLVGALISSSRPRLSLHQLCQPWRHAWASGGKWRDLCKNWGRA